MNTFKLVVVATGGAVSLSFAQVAFATDAGAGASDLHAKATQATTEATGGQTEARDYYLANPVVFRAVTPLITANQSERARADGSLEGPAALLNAVRRVDVVSTSTNASETSGGEQTARAFYLANQDKFTSVIPPLTAAQKTSAEDQGYLEGSVALLNPVHPNGGHHIGG